MPPLHVHMKPPSRCISLRPFSTTPRALKVAPESPKFIEIPQPPPIKPTWKPYVKGKLPRPKTIFRDVGPNKTDPEQLNLMTPEPTKAKKIPENQPEVKAFIEWKAKMAETRRKNLREGITELYQEKEDFDKKRAEISALRNKEREELLAKQQREDVRLTLPSVLSTVRNNGPIRDPNREERIQKKITVREEKERLKDEERMEQIHELYTHASSFILTEAQLDEAISTEFTEDEHSYTGMKMFPMTVTEMLSRRGGGAAVAALTSYNSKDNELMLDVGAALTGGRLPSGSLKALAMKKESENPIGR